MSLKIIMGNMFSGKTSELIRRLKRYKVIGKRILVINSKKDTRASEDGLRTHDNIRLWKRFSIQVKRFYSRVSMVIINKESLVNS